MSLLITRSTPTRLSERIRRGDRLGVFAVAAYVPVLLAVAGSSILNVPLDAAFAAIISAVVVVIGLAVRMRQTDEDREVFDIR